MDNKLSSTIESLKCLFDEFSKAKGLISEIASRGFVMSEIKREEVLFVGINPSYPEGSKPESFTFNPTDAVIGYSKHFKKFNDLANFSSNSIEGQFNPQSFSWSYLDLLFLRETKQNKVLSLASHEKGVEFLCQQLQIAHALIENHRPKLIVVCNRSASSFFGIEKREEKNKKENVWLGFKFEFEDLLGVDVISGMDESSIVSKPKTDLIGTPVLFTSTLTYMDNHTKKRLVWQIHHILNNIGKLS